MGRSGGKMAKALERCREEKQQEQKRAECRAVVAEVRKAGLVCTGPWRSGECECLRWSGYTRPTKSISGGRVWSISALVFFENPSGDSNSKQPR